jgi:hypothetical protein
LHSQPSEIEIHVDHSLVGGGGVNPLKNMSWDDDIPN